VGVSDAQEIIKETEVVVHPQVRTWLERGVLQPYLSELHSHFQRSRLPIVP
jgi:hypothetical protein